MQFQLISVVLILLNCMEYIGSQNASRGRRHRRTNTGVNQGCPKGCDRCSEFNGCLSCMPRLFFSLERNGMKQTGVCLSSCPSGYYGVRTPEMNKCAQCTADNCDTCFNKNFCTKCKPAFYLHKGRCFDICPEGFAPNNQTMECTTTVHCEVGEWNAWSPCTKRGRTCGFRRGSESRSRDIVLEPSAHGNSCPKTTERRKCNVQKKRCPPGQKGNKSKEPKKPGREMTQDKQGKGSRRGKENKGGRVRKERPENKKRRGQSKKQIPTTVSTVQ
ncbi:R-spondin-3 [Amblyraja radiata]|uniref:R-spondin-3 n=1 Tax=Amblyraja radiata TaxID=386614 RepID=UPI0014028DB8|nr:R-spondin-3 [Amblyraja radiata]XP_055491627.1 R-spondin-3 [Leucoraja erinacea]